MKAWFQRNWNDPVWSKVIAWGISGAIGTLLVAAWGFRAELEPAAASLASWVVADIRVSRLQIICWFVGGLAIAGSLALVYINEVLEKARNSEETYRIMIAHMEASTREARIGQQELTNRLAALTAEAEVAKRAAAAAEALMDAQAREDPESTEARWQAAMDYSPEEVQAIEAVDTAVGPVRMRKDRRLRVIEKRALQFLVAHGDDGMAEVGGFARAEGVSS
jgi:hypothetical protein